jgi:hypothetical protein
MTEPSERIARGCTQAAAGYAAAATAAYTAFACSALDFWCTALSGLAETPVSSPTAVQQPVVAPTVTEEPPFGMSLADWSPMSWFDPQRYQSLWYLTPMTPPAQAAMAMANAVPLRGTSGSWGMARVMIDSGVPRSIAWPAAEANAAALEAADVASNGFRTVLANFHTESGYASIARSMTPSLIVLALTLGASMTPLPAWQVS